MLGLQNKHKAIAPCELDAIDVVAHAWGLLFTSSRELIAWNLDTRSPVLRGSVMVSVDDAAAVKDEIDEVSIDRLAEWPTVDKYRMRIVDGVFAL